VTDAAELPRVDTWRASRTALAAEVARVVTLLRNTPDPPPRPAGEAWGFAEIATHLSHGWMTLPQLSQGDVAPIIDLVGQSAITHPSEMGALTEGAVAADPERDPLALADRIETAASAYLATCSDDDVTKTTQWIVDDVMAPVPMFTAHLLSETVLHGLDLARAAGRPWRVEPAHASMALHEFLVPVIHRIPERLIDADALRCDRIVLDIRLRQAPRLRLRFENDGLHADDPADRGSVDAHIATDPATFLVYLWGRRSLAQTLVRGRMVVWGRAPWRAVSMARAVGLP
jgi:hypothetical protein